MTRFDRIEPEEHADLRVIMPAFDTKAGYKPHNDDPRGSMIALVIVLVSAFITAGLIAWGIHAAITGAGAMPAHCATLECAVAGGL